MTEDIIKLMEEMRNDTINHESMMIFIEILENCHKEAKKVLLNENCSVV